MKKKPTTLNFPINMTFEKIDDKTFQFQFDAKNITQKKNIIKLDKEMEESIKGANSKVIF